MVFDLKKKALAASGIRDKDLIHSYLDKMYFLSRQFSPKGTRDFSSRTRAEELFIALWKYRPNRYQPQGCFRLDRDRLGSSMGGRAPSISHLSFCRPRVSVESCVCTMLKGALLTMRDLEGIRKKRKEKGKIPSNSRRTFFAIEKAEIYFDNDVGFWIFWMMLAEFKKKRY